MCVPGLEHSGHVGVSTLPTCTSLRVWEERHRPLGSRTWFSGGWMSRCPSLTFHSIACLPFIQAPCCGMAIALLLLFSSTEARTSSCTSLCLSLLLAKSYRVAARLPSLALPCATAPRMAFCEDSSSPLAQNLQPQSWGPHRLARAKGVLGGFHVGKPKP